MIKTLTKQFILSCYSDGTIRLTERKLTKRNSLGQFSGISRTCTHCAAHLGTGVCPVCGTVLNISALAA